MSWLKKTGMKSVGKKIVDWRITKSKTVDDEINHRRILLGEYITMLQNYKKTLANLQQSAQKFAAPMCEVGNFFAKLYDKPQTQRMAWAVKKGDDVVQKSLIEFSEQQPPLIAELDQYIAELKALKSKFKEMEMAWNAFDTKRKTFESYQMRPGASKRDEAEKKYDEAKAQYDAAKKLLIAEVDAVFADKYRAFQYHFDIMVKSQLLMFKQMFEQSQAMFASLEANRAIASLMPGSGMELNGMHLPTSAEHATAAGAYTKPTSAPAAEAVQSPTQQNYTAVHELKHEAVNGSIARASSHPQPSLSQTRAEYASPQGRVGAASVAHRNVPGTANHSSMSNHNGYANAANVPSQLIDDRRTRRRSLPAGIETPRGPDPFASAASDDDNSNNSSLTAMLRQDVDSPPHARRDSVAALEETPRSAASRLSRLKDPINNASPRRRPGQRRLTAGFRQSPLRYT